jgi:CII-binding regulator of phage lambda lysogenization HflD
MTKSSIALLEGATDTLLKSVFREIEIDTNTIAKDFVPMLDSIKKGLKELKEKIENNNPIYENDLLKYNESLMEYIDRINNLDDNIKLKPYIFRH